MMANSTANEFGDNVDISESWIPRVGMEFDSVDHAWKFWLEYGGKMGFNVRKHYANKSKDGLITSRRFLCSKEGFRRTDKRDHMTTNPRAETSSTRRYKALCQKFVKMASRASNFVESSALVDSGLNNLTVEIEKLLLNLKIEKSGAPIISNMNANEEEGETHVIVPNKITLKPKEGKKGGKRRKSWTEKFHQTKISKKKVSNQPDKENIPAQEGENQMVLPQQFMPFGNNYQNSERPCSSYTQLLLGETYGRHEAPSYCALWKGSSFPSQIMNVQNFSELHSQANLSYMPTENTQGH